MIIHPKYQNIRRQVYVPDNAEFHILSSSKYWFGLKDMHRLIGAYGVCIDIAYHMVSWID